MFEDGSFRRRPRGYRNRHLKNNLSNSSAALLLGSCSQAPNGYPASSFDSSGQFSSIYDVGALSQPPPPPPSSSCDGDQPSLPATSFLGGLSPVSPPVIYSDHQQIALQMQQGPSSGSKKNEMAATVAAAVSCSYAAAAAAGYGLVGPPSATAWNSHSGTNVSIQGPFAGTATLDGSMAHHAPHPPTNAYCYHAAAAAAALHCQQRNQYFQGGQSHLYGPAAAPSYQLPPPPPTASTNYCNFGYGAVSGHQSFSL